MSRKTYVVRITLDDYRVPVEENLSIGLHNVNTITDETIEVGETSFSVIDAHLFREDSQLRITDGVNTDYLNIESVDYENNEIFTRTGTTNTYAIGASLNSNSCFMLAMDDIDNESDWISGLITIDGIDNVVKSMRKVGIGFVGAITSSSITLTNTNKFWNIVKNAGYSITGSLYEVLQYRYDTEDFKIIWAGYCEQPDWDSKEYKIEAKTINRSAILNKEPNSIFIGKNIPAKLEPVISEEIFEINNLSCIKRLKKTNTTRKAFPYRSSSAVATGNKISIMIGSWCDYDSTKFEESTLNLDGLFLKIKSGKGKGAVRKIVNITDINMISQVLSAYGFPVNICMLTVYIDELFSEDEIDSTSHLIIVKKNITYQTQDPDIDIITNTLKDKDRNTLPHTAIVKDGEQLQLNGCYLYGNKKSYLLITPNYISSYYDSNVRHAEIIINDFIFHQWKNSGESSYVYITASKQSEEHTADVLFEQYCIDKLGNNYFSTSIITKATNIYSSSKIKSVGAAIAFRLNLVDPIKSTSERNISIGLKLRTKYTPMGSTPGSSYLINIRAIPIYAGIGFMDGELQFNKTINTGHPLFPVEYYYFNNIDKSYYSNVESSAFSGDTVSITVPETDIDRLEAIAVICTVYQEYLVSGGNSVQAQIEIGIAEACIISSSDFNETDDIYCKANGRKFNTSNWSRYITSADIIRRPSDIIEHCCRLSNWHDTCDMPINGYGYAYSPSAKIAISGEGSFANNAIQLYSESMKLSAQITGEQTTEEIKERVCFESGLISYAGADRYERILLAYDDTEAVDNIGLSDIIDISEVHITEQSTSNIYCEPIVRYNFDPITNKYLNSLSISGTAAEIYSDNYVSGDIIAASEKEVLWNQCRLLYKKVRVINKPSSSLTDLKFANDPETMETVALNYLRNWIRSMLAKEISFRCHSDLVMDWELGHLFNITLPHQTNNNAYRCILREIEIETSGKYIATIKAIVTDEIPHSQYIYDTNNVSAEVWQDTNTATGDNQINDTN